MPASPFSVWINLMGSVNPSVARSISQVNRQLVGLQATVTATNRAMRMGFGRLLGLGAGLVGIGSIVAGMKQAVDLASQNEQIQEATLVILRNQRELRHESSQLAVQDLKTLNEQAVRLQQQTGLYKNVFERGSLILAQSRLNVNQIRSLQPVMGNLLAAQRMQGKSAEDMQQTYKAIGMAIERGMGRSLSRTGVVLTPMEQRMLQMNALVGNIAANIKIVENAITRTYAGMAKLRMQTLTGRVELAMANMRLSMERMGDALRPIGQRLIIIFTRIIPLIEPVVIRLANIISEALKSHMKDIAAWMDLIRRQAIPLVLEWINKGWVKLQGFVKWFMQNKDWLVPWIKYIALAAAGVAALVTVVGGAIAVFTFFGSSINIVIVALAAVGAALLAVIQNWRSFKDMVRGIGEWLVGTKQLDPKNQGYGPGVMRGFRKGVVPRAQPVQKGVLWNWVDQLSAVLDKGWTQITAWLGRVYKSITKWFGDVFDATEKWFGTVIDNIWENLTKWLGDTYNFIVKWVTDVSNNTINLIATNIFDPIKTSIIDTGKTLLQWLISPITDLGQRWKEFISGIKLSDEFQSGNGSGESRGTTADWSHTPTRPTLGVYNPLAPSPIGRQPPFSGAVRTMSEWVPGEPRTRATQYGHFGHLQLNDIAMSVDMMKRMNLHFGDYVDLLDKQGKVILAHQRIADTSWFREGVQTHGIELWGRPDIGWSRVVPEGRNRPADVAKKEPSGSPVTINYTVHHHHEGGAMDEHRIASIHRKHIEQMTRDLAEVTYRRNRSAFDGAQAV